VYDMRGTLVSSVFHVGFVSDVLASWLVHFAADLRVPSRCTSRNICGSFSNILSVDSCVII
jgi:hypothetical protein